MTSLVVVWLVVLLVGGFLFERFTRPPVAAGGTVSSGRGIPRRRVYPLWLVLLLFVLLVLALWFTIRWGVHYPPVA